ncbi:MAG: bifunctional diguanylate cyclase/phosphodiesterase [Sphingomonadaceae bacterium]|nr:bifunctional diguanylate cyclase/phosphodiesterase [Sphingomonadaceae bacterium]
MRRPRPSLRAVTGEGGAPSIAKGGKRSTKQGQGHRSDAAAGVCYTYSAKRDAGSPAREGKVITSAPTEPLFLLSFHQRDALAAATERAGWTPVAARRSDGLEQRFLASGAAIAVIDAREALDAALDAVRALADPAAASGSALLFILDRAELPRLAEVHRAGATHYLAAPFADDELATALRFAARHAERAAAAPDGTQSGADLGWSWRSGDDAILLTPALAALLGASERVALPVLWRSLGRDGIRAAREGLRRLRGGAPATAFAHRSGAVRYVHHLHRRDDMLVGRVERLDTPGARPRKRRDRLTGLADARDARHWIGERLRAATAMPVQPLVLLLVAAAQLETVNRTYGRDAGDALLRAVAQRIEEVLGTVERRLIARMSGSEFLIGLTEATLDEARLLADGLAAAIARPFVIAGHSIGLGPHIGIAVAESTGESATSLLRRASLALGQARASEYQPVRLLGAREEDEAARLAALAVDLRHALERREIALLWQPQVAVTGGAIVGVEALARWRHPRLGELGAELLFAVAERSNYLAELSEHVQRRAMGAVAAWPAALSHLRVSINVVAADIARRDFDEAFLRALDSAGLDPRRVTVEIVESGLIGELERAGALLARLRAAGLRVAIDDFGTGYSSLAYLKALPLDYLKLDRRLSQDIVGSARDRVVVRGVIEMARSLGIAVIAEGIETEAQRDALAHEGCDYYQGFLCARPLDLGGLKALVESRRS